MVILEDAPKGFVSRKSLPSKNQKAHLKYLKKKRNKINGHTDQHELPKFNQIGESVVSNLKDNYIPKGHRNLSEFKSVPISKSTILKYKRTCDLLSHVRYGSNIDGSIYLDNKDKVVGFFSVEEKNNKQKWLQAMEVAKPYQGYGLSKQLLYLAVTHYGARYLSVNKKNQVAIRLYENAGFVPYEDTESMIFMKISTNSINLNECSILEAVGRNTKPIFIVNSWTNTPFGKLIRVGTQSIYTHSAISLDTSLGKLYSFNADNKLNKLGGVSLESLSGYISVYKDCRINVSCIFVKDTDFEIIKKALDHMVSHQDQTTYDFINIFNVLLGRSKEMSDKAMTMICSQFVAYILSKADIRITDKSINLITPKDLVTTVTSNPRVYLLYDGLGREYDKKKIDRIFRKLKQKALLIKECSL